VRGDELDFLVDTREAVSAQVGQKSFASQISLAQNVYSALTAAATEGQRLRVMMR